MATREEERQESENIHDITIKEIKKTTGAILELMGVKPKF